MDSSKTQRVPILYYFTGISSQQSFPSASFVEATTCTACTVPAIHSPEMLDTATSTEFARDVEVSLYVPTEAADAASRDPWATRLALAPSSSPQKAETKQCFSLEQPQQPKHKSGWLSKADIQWPQPPFRLDDFDVDIWM